LIQSGISEIIGPEHKEISSKWDEDLAAAHQMMVEYGISIRLVGEEYE